MVDDEFSALQLKAAILFVTLAATVLVYFRVLRPSLVKNTDWKTELSSTKASYSSKGEDLTMKDVWSQRKSRGVTASSTSNKQSAPADDKPFGSSYYYAHNNPNATGGYKDGLKMEDYTMNQPRLLSKGGVPADQQTQSGQPQEPTTETKSTTEPTVASTTTNRGKKIVPVKRISKFLWDDPGDSKGIATIRIDTLPGATLTETISWREGNISDIVVSLVDDKKGLLIELTSGDSTKYCLLIPKLHGQVDEVRKVVKPNRLLVRVYKTKGWVDRKNLQAWPHP